MERRFNSIRCFILGIALAALVGAVAVNSRGADIPKPLTAHWAFQPLSNPTIPLVKETTWLRSPIDAFVLSNLEAVGIAHSPPADRRTLLRRVYLDLIGLPPTPREQQTFLDDNSPDALEKVVDDLLARPQYGERWGRHWLDLARYAETQGYERDEPKPFTWRYRDYVIDSFNQDKPYDGFLTEQLAGDEVDGSDANTQTALTFLRLGPFDTIAADATLARYDQLDDVVSTTSSVFLGLTLRCARCHDHKFEPLSQSDYYRMLAVFQPLKNKDAETFVASPAQLAAYNAASAKVDALQLPLLDKLDDLRAMVGDRLLTRQEPATTTNPQADASKGRRTFLKNLLPLLRKSAAQRNKSMQDQVAKGRERVDLQIEPEITPAEKTAIHELQSRVDALDTTRPRGAFAFIFNEDSRKAPVTHLLQRGDPARLGELLEPGVPAVLGCDPPNPPALTGHTTGRRLWLAHWMTGPARPLVARVMANRIWQYHFGRGIVATPNDLGTHGDTPTHPELLDWLANELVQGGWRIKRLHRMIVLSSTYQTSAGYQPNDTDPQDKLLWHYPTHRLEAEAIRDSILAVSGQINLEVGGPSVFPPLAQKVVGDSAQLGWGNSDEHQASRRSVYVYSKRSVALPELEVLGLPDLSSACDTRTVSTTALQSLMLLNSKFVSRQADFFAQRVRREAGEDVADQIRRAFALALGRPPRQSETAAALEFLANERGARLGAASDLHALAAFCQVLFNTSEFVYAN